MYHRNIVDVTRFKLSLPCDVEHVSSFRFLSRIRYTKWTMSDLKQKSDSYWKEKLTLEQYKTLREKGTDIPFTGSLLRNKESGIYTCAACGTPLFASDTKFDSGSGWPSFSDVLEKGNIELKEDHTGGMNRTEVVCATCGGHLGHVFNDGPTSTGQRYCINGTALNFKSPGNT